MTPAELGAAIATLHGTHKGAVADAARALRVNPDNLRHMLAARRPIPDGLASEIGRRLALRDIVPPPAALAPHLDRDGPCGEALDPHLDDLLQRAVQAGWEPAEVVAAALGWAVHCAIDGAGAEATQELLDGAREIVVSAQTQRHTPTAQLQTQSVSTVPQSFASAVNRDDLGEAAGEGRPFDASPA